MGNSIERMVTFLLKVLPVGIAASGGAMMVFSGYDDAPGGTLLGFLMILLSAYLVVKQRPGTT